MEKLTLRQLCELCGVSRRTIQGYEKAGLVQPIGKNERGYLLYGKGEIQKVSNIRALQSYGFTIKEVVQYEQADSERQVLMLQEKLERMILKHSLINNLIIEIRLLIQAKTKS